MCGLSSGRGKKFSLSAQEISSIPFFIRTYEAEEERVYAVPPNTSRKHAPYGKGWIRRSRYSAAAAAASSYG